MIAVYYTHAMLFVHAVHTWYDDGILWNTNLGAYQAREAGEGACNFVNSEIRTIMASWTKI